MRLVADAGPLIALAKVDRLELVVPLFEEIWLPEVVMHEVLAKPGVETQRLQAAIGRFLRVGSPPLRLSEALEAVARGLDEGEKAVIALAGALPPPATVLMDDAAGRAVARRANLGVVGLAGLLIKARERGLLDRVIPLLLEARDRGYWLDRQSGRNRPAFDGGVARFTPLLQPDRPAATR